MRALGLVVVAAVTLVAAGSGSPAAATEGASGCAVSRPGGEPVPGRSSFNFGNRRIAVALPPRATFVAVRDGRPGGAWVQRDGTIRTKVGWWRARGELRIAGRRLDRRSAPLRADVGPLSWTSQGVFVPSELFFPSVGCWRITATAGGARLDAVVRVVRR
ncbi:MAG: hypothetical protein ICV59_09915 [Thermoleophilia bacterium]|nr:hypothetical protein [Thermoleophilia bacterium]